MVRAKEEDSRRGEMESQTRGKEWGGWRQGREKNKLRYLKLEIGKYN